MGETLRPVAAGFNRSLTIEARADRLTGDPGAMLLREVLDATGIVPWMAAQMKDDRRQADVIHDLSSLLRTMMLLVAQGWRDHDDADALRNDPAMRLAVSSSAGLTPLTQSAGLPSQPTLSRCTAMLARPGNIKVLREAALELAGRHLRAENGGARRTRITLDVDSLPIEVHGHQSKAEWNGMGWLPPILDGIALCVHVARRAMARATGSAWSLRRLRERVLRAGARLVISARRITLILAEAAAPFWAAIWPQIQMLRGASP